MSIRPPAGSCPKCGTWREHWAKDHIIPRWKFKAGFVLGNPNDPTNIQFICDNCHADKTLVDLAEANQHRGGGGHKGHKHSLETRAQMSRNRIGQKRPRSSEHQAKITAAQIGRKLSLETRSKISSANMGFKCSSETIDKRRATLAKNRYDAGLIQGL